MQKSKKKKEFIYNLRFCDTKFFLELLIKVIPYGALATSTILQYFYILKWK